MMKSMVWQEQGFAYFSFDDKLIENSSLSSMINIPNFKNYLSVCTKCERNKQSFFVLENLAKNLLEVDSSTIFPLFKMDIKTSGMDKNLLEKDDKIIEHDIYIKMPPKKEYHLRIKINEIKKGKPIIVIP